MSASKQMTITTTPSLVGRVVEGSLNIWVHAGGTIYFGGDNTVSSSTGFRLDNNDKYSTIIPEGNEVWAVTNSGSQTLYVFTTAI
jgi:hypothetical protein